MKNRKLNTYDIVLTGILTAILFVQEEALTFIPNVQLTVFLIVLYSKTVGYFRTSIIVFIHVLLDNLVMGSMNVVTFVPMLIGWELIPIIICTLGRKVEKPVFLALFSIPIVLIYDFIFALFNYWILDIDLITWYTGGIIFDIVLIMSSFLSILWLYTPLKKVIDNFDNKYHKTSKTDNDSDDDISEKNFENDQ